MPITQEKLEQRILVLYHLSLCHFFLSFICLCPTFSPSHTHAQKQTHKSISLPRIKDVPSLTRLGALTRSSAQCVCFITAANMHARPFQTQPAWLLCDREANLLRQNTFPSHHATLAPFHQPAYYIRISLHACHNNAFTTNECGAFCPKLAVTCFSKGHK